MIFKKNIYLEMNLLWIRYNEVNVGEIKYLGF